ncbi:MAG: branched-chain amino acid aminotransferase [Alistipes sp.]|nr:branched-chain amino acid aminotransferase [Alistipes sp.]
MENLDWSALGFSYNKTDFNVRYAFTDGKWSEMEITSDEYVKIHMSAYCLHYGIELFEGLKAFRGVDGKVRLFRVEENAKRLISSAERLCLPVPTVEMIVDACIEVVKRNERFIPPYGTGASFYLRPVMFGTTAGLGVKPSQDALLVVYGSPVGAYFKEGIKPISVVIDRDQDRAAPRGTGDVKVGGNYAASLLSGERAHKMGYSNVIYLDAAEHKYIEECGAANFFGIKEGKYITPKSPSVLPSITNKSLRQLAADMGLTIEERHIPVEELPTFEECGACGTAAVISPIGKIFDLQTEEKYDYGTEVGATCMKLYTQLQDIQYGRAEDKYGWCTIVL